MRNIFFITVLAALPQAFSSAAPATQPAHRVTTADREIKDADAFAKRIPDAPQPFVKLATAYMHKARETGDVAYYTRAEAACRKALQLKPDDYAANRELSWIYSGLHRFDEAVTAARKSLQADPNDPFNYGLLSDALIELGQYTEAESAVQKMADLRPDVAAFTRVAYMRELLGDTEGAIDMMRQAALGASAREPEHSAWCQVQLANLLFNSGQLNDARQWYELALRTFPDYHYALTGMGRVCAAQKEFEEAIGFYRRSLELVPSYDTVVSLGELLAHLNRPEEAAQQFAVIEAIEQLYRANNVPPDAMMVLYHADHDADPAKALSMARDVATHRQDVRTIDALAWALHRAGHDAEALEASRKSLRLGTKDAMFHYHFGMIHRTLGHDTESEAELKQALQINPAFDVIRAEEATAALAAGHQ